MAIYLGGDLVSLLGGSKNISGDLSLQDKQVTPTESTQVITHDSGFDGLGNVTVNPIGSDYVGSSISRRSSTDLTASGSTVTVPSGYYASQSSKSVATGTAGTPSASKGSVSNHSISITPEVTNVTGYITGGKKTGTPVTVYASDLVSGSETKTQNGTYDVTNLSELVVNVSGGDYNVESTTNADGTQNIIITDAEGGGSGGDVWVAGIGRNPVLVKSYVNEWTLEDTTFDPSNDYTTASLIKSSQSSMAMTDLYDESVDIVAIGNFTIVVQHEDSATDTNRQISWLQTNIYGSAIYNRSTSARGFDSLSTYKMTNRYYDKNGNIDNYNYQYGFYTQTNTLFSFGQSSSSRRLTCSAPAVYFKSSENYVESASNTSKIVSAEFKYTAEIYIVDRHTSNVGIVLERNFDALNNGLPDPPEVPASASFMMSDEDEPFEEIIEQIEEGDEMP